MKKYFSLTVVCVMGVSFLSVLLNYQIKDVIDAISNQDTYTFFSQIAYLLGIILLLLVVEYGRKVFNILYLNKVGSYFHSKSLNSSVEKGILLQEEEQLSVGEKVSEITNDIEMVKELYYDTKISMIQGVTSFIFSTIALYYLNIWVATAILLTMLLPILIPLLFKNSLKRKQESISLAKKKYITYLSDLLRNKLLVKNSYSYRTIMGVAVHKYEKINTDTLTKERQVALVDVLVGFGFYMSLIAILLVGGIQVLHEKMTIGALISMFSISQELTLPANLIASSISQIQSVQSIFENLMKQSHEDNPKEISIKNLENIRIEQVSIPFQNFMLDHSKRMIFEKGNKYLITGKSGGGKSILTLILTGNLTAFNGEVYLNNKKLQDISYESLQKEISYIPQNASLFHDTIRNNITSYQEIEDEKLLELIYRFQLQDRFPTIESLEQVYTEDSSLSGGQIQRIILIKVLLEDKKWIVLDEAISALDRDLYRKIEHELLQLEDRTVIHISHREESLVNDLYDEVIQL